MYRNMPRSASTTRIVSMPRSSQLVICVVAKMVGILAMMLELKVKRVQILENLQDRVS